MAERAQGTALGAHLRALRQGRGVSLDQIARDTRIQLRQLQALESGDTLALPAAVFVRGFVRAYCQALGEDPAEALRLTGLTHPLPTRPWTASRRQWARAFAAEPVAISFALLLVMGAGLLVVNAVLRPEEAPPFAESTAATRAAATPSAALAPGPVRARGPQRLVIRALEPVWVRVQLEGGRVDEELLAPGARREWTADRGFLVSASNAPGLLVELNGRPVSLAGGRGVAVRNVPLPPPPPRS
jgi:cytoskeleton protein RodZ